MLEIDRRTAAVDQPLRFTRFAVRRTGLVESQVRIRVGSNLLASQPYQLSPRRGVFVAVLTPGEMRFFQRFRRKPCAISMVFRPAGGHPREFQLRAILDRLVRVAGDRCVCFLTVTLLSCPRDLEGILGACRDTVDNLRRLYEFFAGQSIPLDKETAAAGVPAYAELRSGRLRSWARVRSIAADALGLELPAQWDALRPGARCTVRIPQPTGVFEVTAEVAARSAVLENGSLALSLSADFTPELVDIVDRFFFRRSLEGVGIPA